MSIKKKKTQESLKNNTGPVSLHEDYTHCKGTTEQEIMTKKFATKHFHRFLAYLKIQDEHTSFLLSWRGPL